MIKLKIPKGGDAITFKKGKIVTPNFPIIPYIIGDGIGVDVTPVMIKVLDHAVKKAYKNEKQIKWLEIFAGKSAHDLCGHLLPSETLKAMKNLGHPYKGFLYAGLMICEGEPYLIEYNIRMGDPECQVLMMLSLIHI